MAVKVVQADGMGIEEHAEGRSFKLEYGMLYVRDRNGSDIAVYSDRQWASATVE